MSIDAPPVGHVAAVGSDESQLSTPCLVVRRDVLDRNLRRVSQIAERYPDLRVRPMTKSHKCGRLAQRQMGLGAVGITVAKLAEAEVMVEQGLDNILISVPVIGPSKIERLVRLAGRASITIVADDLPAARQIAAAAEAAGATLDVLVEVDTGYGRCGVAPPEAPALADAVAALPALEFRGLMTYEGHVYDEPAPDVAEATARRCCRTLVETADRVRENGLPLDIVSVGASATVEIAAAFDGITEVRPGSYIFNDVAATRVGPVSRQDIALWVKVTVVSRPRPGLAITDAGSKALSFAADPGAPGYGWVAEFPDARVVKLSDEYGFLDPVPDDVSVGDVLHVLPNQHPSVVDLYDVMYEVADGRITDIYEVDARGKRS